MRPGWLNQTRDRHRAGTFVIMSFYRVAVHDKRAIKRIKSILESHNCLDKSTKIFADSNGTFLIPVRIPKTVEEKPLIFFQSLLPEENFSLVETANRDDDSAEFDLQLKKLLHSADPDLDDVQTAELIREFPKRYSIYPPLLLLPQRSLDSKVWSYFLDSLDDNTASQIYRFILNHFSTPSNKLTHLAINKPIPEVENEIRSPSQLTTLYGDFTDFWCHTIQNGIYQTWMPSHTMFSRGNIKEKARILTSYKNITRNSDIVDMYAGIGYFTLSYLKRGARRVFCWEINPYSVEGLARGVTKNGFGQAYVIKRKENIDLAKVLKSRCIVFLESNVHCLDRMSEMMNHANDSAHFELNISHINLGLLPSSVDSWPYACKLIDLYGDKHSNAWIHVHENIGVSELDNMLGATGKKLQIMSQKREVIPTWLEKVKTFAPDVYHVVADFELKPLAL